MNSTVSIVIPIYKVEKYIKNTLESVVYQSYPDIELILVDDCGGDRSCDIAEKYLNEMKYSYKLIRHEKNMGQALARNTGTKAAEGKWIFFLDSDDLIVKNTIEILVKVAIKNESKAVFSGFRYIKNSLEIDNMFHEEGIEVLNQNEVLYGFLKREIRLLAPGTLYERELLISNNLMFENIPWSEDQHFLWRLLSCVDKVVYVKAPLYQYLLHGNSIMSATTVEKMVIGYEAIVTLKSYYPNNINIGRYIESRWVMGTLNSASKIVDYKKWKQLKNHMMGRHNFKILLAFPDKRVKILAAIGLFLPKCYYKIVKKRKL